MSLHPEELARIVRVLGVVLDEPESFTADEVSFARGLAADIEQQREIIVLSPAQKARVDGLEAKARELGR